MKKRQQNSDTENNMKNRIATAHLTNNTRPKQHYHSCGEASLHNPSRETREYHTKVVWREQSATRTSTCMHVEHGGQGTHTSKDAHAASEGKHRRGGRERERPSIKQKCGVSARADSNTRRRRKTPENFPVFDNRADRTRKGNALSE